MNRFLIIIIITIVFCVQTDNSLGFSYTEENQNLLYSQKFNFLDDYNFQYETSINSEQFNDSYLNFSLEKDSISYALFGKLNNVFSSKVSPEAVMGVKIPVSKISMFLGMKVDEKKNYPYLSLTYRINNFVPYLSFSDKIQIGLYYGLNLLDKNTISEYFSIISPHENSNTNKGYIYIKGYYLDRGKIYLNNKPLKLRSDGMFIEKIDLLDYGKNQISFFMDGKNISNYEHQFVVNRNFQYLDLEVEQQKEWIEILNKLQYPEGYYFYPDKEVTKKEFYLQLAELVDMENELYQFNNLFIDVDYVKLRKYLFTYYGKGLLKVPYKYFNPDKTILRQEAMTVISRLLDDKTSKEKFTFLDIEYKNWFYEYANKLKNYNLIVGDKVRPTDKLTRKEFYALMKQLSEVLKIKFERKEKNLQVPKNEKEMIDQSQFNFDDLNIISPKQNLRVTDTPFTAKGYGPIGMIFQINNKDIKVSSRGRFADSIPLKAGLNTILIRVKNIEKKYMVLYLKQFQDLSNNDFYTDIIEKVATLGYIDTEDLFYPNDYVTKEELITTLIKLGVINRSQLKKLKDPEEIVVYKDAIDLLNKLTKSNIVFNPSFEHELTRKAFALILYEVPLVKQQIKRFYNNDN